MDGAAPGGLSELRGLLIGAELEALQDLQDRLEDPERRTQDVSRVLPEALARHSEDPALSKAISPTVEAAVLNSVRTNPRALADALFPVIGPAIRKSLSHMLAAMLDGMNRALQHSFSLQSLGWRLEALRTGKSFSEIVLLRTLLYRVEQLFLIHRETGLLLRHVTADGSTEGVQDADMVSGMLTAIRDFVQDSFGGAESGQTLEELRVGEMDVWVVQGPHAILAAVVRGNAPKELRNTLEEALEAIHLRFGTVLGTFQGDTEPFAEVHDYLEPCLRSQYRGKEGAERKRLVPAAALGLIIALAAWWAVSSWMESRRWNDYLTRLRAEPGIVVVSEETRGGNHYVVGLHDPLSRDPADILSETSLDPGRVIGRWEPYQALLPRFVVIRSRAILQPPPDVSLSFANGVLYVRGPADTQWMREADRLAKLVPGVLELRRGEALESALDRMTPEIEAIRLHFATDDPEPLPDQDEIWERLLTTLRELTEAAAMENRALQITVVGYADSTGGREWNLELSQARADNVRDTILAAGITNIEFGAVGRGVRDPSAEGESAEDRYVTFQIAILPQPARP
jgi:OOP family OmpA-OmpF porin